MSKPNAYRLDAELAELLAGMRKDESDSSSKLAVIAAEIRSQFLDGKSYDPRFKAFWRTYSMNERFGVLANFTRYAGAGSAAGRITKLCPDKAEAIPRSIAGAYEVSQLTDEEITLCLENTFSRTVKTADRGDWKGPTPPPALITSLATGPQIRAWRKAWRNPTVLAQPKARKLAEIWLNAASGNEANGLNRDAYEKKLAEVAEVLRASLAPYSDLLSAEIADPINSAKRKSKKGRNLTGSMLARAIDKWLETLLRSYYLNGSAKKKGVPFGVYRLLVSLSIDTELRDVPDGATKKLSTEIVSPTKNEIIQRLAREYLQVHGARRLLSLVHRCRGQGVWSEKETRLMKNGRKKRVSTKEKELNSARAKFALNRDERWTMVIHKLENILPEKYSHCSDEDLSLAAEGIIDGFVSRAKSKS